jgi:glycosyltransferase involved in cell wall biosynthesis
MVYCGASPLVSVYVPTFNRAELLITRALSSVRAQTYRNWDCIVAAHGCTDDTVKRVAAIGDPRIRVIEVARTQTYPPTPENHWFAGPVVPANAALKECRGAWIARIDDDDEWTPDHLERLLWLAQDANLEFVSSAYETGSGETVEKTSADMGYRVTRTITDRRVIEHDGHEIPIGGTQTWLYRSYLKFMRYNPDCWRKQWDRVNDTDLAQRFRNAGVRIGHINEVTARVLPRPGENAVGLKAYKSREEHTMEQFAFR